MDLNAVLALVKVVEQGSFRGAAKVLDMPKSTVSRKIAELEAHLGVQLLQRSTRKLSLTDAGAAYVDHAAAAIAQLESAELALSEVQRTPRGRLRVTATPQMGQSFLAPLVMEFLRAYPEVEVSMHLTDRHVDLIAERFDVALRAGELPDSTLVAHRLGAGTVRVVGSPEYLHAHGAPTTLADLAGHVCLIATNSVGANRGVWRFGEGRSARDVAIAGCLSADDFVVLRAAAERGLGLARLPDLLVRDSLRAGALVSVLDEFAPPVTPLHLVHLGGRYVTPRTRAFLEFMKPRLIALLAEMA